MNITFCVSSMPNQRIVSGISAATGRLRPNSASGAPAASTRRHEPATMPSGTPTSDREAEADPARAVASPRCWRPVRVRRNRLGKLRTTSAGLGRMTGEISRSSAPGPRVASHHSAHDAADRRRRRPAAASGAAVRHAAAKGAVFESAGIYLAAAASAG